MLLGAFLFSILSLSTAFAADSEYLKEAIARSRELELAKERVWLNLLHYRPTTFSGKLRGAVDDESFFAARDGKKNPQSELEATLALFFEELSPGGESADHALCRYVARYHWLKNELGLQEDKLPRVQCSEFRAWFAALKPAKLSLIFPSAYLNNPASMFGHTLLRIDSADSPSLRRESSALLGYSASYGAETGSDGGALFALKGLFGWYRGYFSILPYYETTKRYNDLENRDIWEYELELSRAEVEFLVKHLWELKRVYFDYYFFSENCSSLLLSFLRVAKPELSLWTRFEWWAIPADTVKALFADASMLRKSVFRPSRASLVAKRASLLSKEEQLLARDLSWGRLAREDSAWRQTGDKKKAELLELSLEYLHYLREREQVAKEEARLRYHALLRERSALPPFDCSKCAEFSAERPDLGHGSARVATALGFEEGEPYYELRFRPAYHDLIDPPQGYQSGAAIDFLDFRLRQKEGEELKLEEVSLLEISSLSPLEVFSRRTSWQLSATFLRRSLTKEREHLRGDFALAGGKAFARGGGTFFALLRGGLAFSDELRDKASFSLGPSAGMLWSLGERFRLLASAYRASPLLGDELRTSSARAEFAYSFGVDSALRLGVSWLKEFGEYKREAEISAHWYF